MQISEVIDKLNDIKKDEIDERTFYEQVLGVIGQLEGVHGSMPDSLTNLKQTLMKIGCKDYDTWKAERESEGVIFADDKLEDGIKNGELYAAVGLIKPLFGHYSEAMFMDLFLEGKEHSYINEWVRKSKELYPENERSNGQEQKNDIPAVPKSQIPYYQVAKEVLMADWNGYSEQEAIQFIESHTFDEIEAKVNARGSMDHAIEKISQMIGVSKEDLEGLVYHGKKLQEDFYLDEGEQIDVLFAVHDGWVRDYPQKFLARDKKYQHMPSELIGWNESKLDLIFVAPIIEKINRGQVNEELLKSSYDAKVREFFLSKGIRNAEDLTNLITKGADFYPALEGYPAEVLEFLAHPNYVRGVVVDSSIVEKGIGDIKQKRAEFIHHIAEEAEMISPSTEYMRSSVEKDLRRLTPEERAEVKQIIDKDAKRLEKEKDELQKQNDTISEILESGQHVMDLKLELAKEQHRRKNIIDGVGE